jgi:KDO2-lipid IV(A) lauroyltransferase
MFYIIKYRKKVVINNLQKAFPNKNKKEINKIAKLFYKNLLDILLESIKGLTMNKQTFLKRFQIINPEYLNNFYNKNISILNLAGHYANWEWGIQAVDMQLKHQVVSIYKPLSNKQLDTYIKTKRERFGMKLVPMDETKNIFTNITKPVSVIMAADQSPSNVHKAIWVNFLNIKTPFIHGPEAYAKKLNTPVVYFDVQRVKRGYYTLEIKNITNSPSSLKQNELTKIYAKTLEQIIKHKPQDWLWSHKRWKHSFNQKIKQNNK